MFSVSHLRVIIVPLIFNYSLVHRRSQFPAVSERGYMKLIRISNALNQNYKKQPMVYRNVVNMFFMRKPYIIVPRA